MYACVIQPYGCQKPINHLFNVKGFCWKIAKRIFEQTCSLETYCSYGKVIHFVTTLQSINSCFNGTNIIKIDQQTPEFQLKIQWNVFCGPWCRYRTVIAIMNIVWSPSTFVNSTSIERYNNLSTVRSLEVRIWPIFQVRRRVIIVVNGDICFFYRKLAHLDISVNVLLDLELSAGSVTLTGKPLHSAKLLLHVWPKIKGSASYQLVCSLSS